MGFGAILGRRGRGVLAELSESESVRWDRLREVELSIGVGVEVLGRSSGVRGISVWFAVGVLSIGVVSGSCSGVDVS